MAGIFKVKNSHMEARSADSMTDRRCELRGVAGQAVTITVLPHMDVCIPGYLTDISSLGLGLKLAWPIGSRASFAIEWGDTLALAEVVYCIEDDSKYHVGLRTSYIVLDRTISRSNSESVARFPQWFARK
jgi:hypothetical protein